MWAIAYTRLWNLPMGWFTNPRAFHSSVVERDEAVARYQRLLVSFAHLIHKTKYYRGELGMSNRVGDAELWDCQICEEAGILEVGEIIAPQDRQRQ